MNLLKQEIPQGNIIPLGWGVAYQDYMRFYAVCYPIPLHWFVTIGRDVYFRLRRRLYETEYDRDFNHAVALASEESYKLGVKHGYKLGVSHGREKTFAELLNGIKHP